MTTAAQSALHARAETEDHAAQIAASLAPNPCLTCPRRVRPAIINLGSLALDAEQQRARWRGQPIALTVGEFNVVRLLAEQSPAYLRYRAIYDVVQAPGFHAGTEGWGYKGNVRSFIKRIRRKFEKVDPGFVAIVNYLSFGYAWKEEGDGTP
jgi:two-component system, OmpR family, response regulator ChvI